MPVVKKRDGYGKITNYSSLVSVKELRENLADHDNEPCSEQLEVAYPDDPEENPEEQVVETWFRVCDEEFGFGKEARSSLYLSIMTIYPQTRYFSTIDSIKGSHLRAFLGKEMIVMSRISSATLSTALQSLISTPWELVYDRTNAKTRYALAYQMNNYKKEGLPTIKSQRLLQVLVVWASEIFQGLLQKFGERKDSIGNRVAATYPYCVMQRACPPPKHR
ncbi:hypothetical protein C5167_029096 [Papaver somniferum]|nr:hypothetical protein C5167_029096 [Papaver somniferum]